MNKPLTEEEATKITYPCLLEVWDNEKRKTKNPTYKIVIGISTNGSRFIDLSNFYWDNAALPSPEITEAMQKQFAHESKFIDETIKNLNADETIKNLNADEAKKISVNNIPEKLYKYLSEIKKQAKKGERFLYVFEPLEDFTHLGLVSRGFTLIDHSVATINTKGLYCTIKW
jgi:hypothetical protein